MVKTKKEETRKSADNATQFAFHDEDASFEVSGFVSGRVGRKVTFTTTTTNVTDDSQLIDFLEDSVSLYTMLLVFTDDTQSVLISVERVS
jgi:hypothetical protein